jgi:hypothetical protein
MYSVKLSGRTLWLPQDVIEQHFNRLLPCTPAKTDS